MWKQVAERMSILPWKPLLLVAAVLLLPVAGGVAVHYDWWGSLTSSSTEGRIIVNSPSVYTRQRLVNDRLVQSAWLKKQLDVTDNALKDFRVIDAVRSQFDENTLTAKITAALKLAQAGTPSAGEQTQPAPGNQAPGTANERENTAIASRLDALRDINPTTADLFRAMNTFREEVRSEMMQTLLDDRHDILGNTIYRLAMDATVLPGRNATDLAVVSITLRQNSDDDYRELYNDWLPHLQKFVNSSVDGLARSFAGRGKIEPRVRVLLPYFLANHLCRAIEGAAGNASTAEKTCDVWARDRAASRDLAWLILKSYVEQYLAYWRKVIEGRFEYDLAAEAKLGNFALLENFFYFDFANRGCEFARTARKETIDSTGQPVIFVPVVGGGYRPARCPLYDLGTEGLIAGLTLHEHLSRNIDHLVEQIRKAPSERNPNAIARSLVDPVRERCPRPDQGTCLTPDLPPDAFGCATADYMVWSLRAFGVPNAPSQDISSFMDIKTVGREVQHCRVLVRSLLTDNASPNGSAKKILEEFRDALGDNEVYAYSISPKTSFQRISTTAATRNVVQLLMGAGATQEKGEATSLAEQVRKRFDAIHTIQQHPIVIGFGQNRGAREARFGWVLGPRRGANGELAQIDGEHSLAAVISVPSWWRSAKLEIRTCWVSRARLLPTRDRPEEICAANNPEDPVAVRLPGVVYDVSRKLGFEVIEEPYLLQDQIPQPLQAGYEGDILLTGGRLWRSTEVTLGSQKATSITVLPNMLGIIAHFECVVDPPVLPTGAVPLTPVTVWTSEGRADHDGILVLPSGLPRPTGTGNTSGRKPCPSERSPVPARGAEGAAAPKVPTPAAPHPNQPAAPSPASQPTSPPPAGAAAQPSSPPAAAQPGSAAQPPAHSSDPQVPQSSAVSPGPAAQPAAR